MRIPLTKTGFLLSNLINLECSHVFKWEVRRLLRSMLLMTTSYMDLWNGVKIKYVCRYGRHLFLFQLSNDRFYIFILYESISQIKKHSSSVARKKNVMYYTANDTFTNIAQKKYCWLYDDMPFLRETKVRVTHVTIRDSRLITNFCM